MLTPQFKYAESDNSAHKSSKSALMLWKSTNFTFLIFMNRQNGLKFKIAKSSF